MLGQRYQKQNFCDIQGLCCNIIIRDHPGGQWEAETRQKSRILVTGTLEGNEKQFVLVGNLSYQWVNFSEILIKGKEI